MIQIDATNILLIFSFSSLGLIVFGFCIWFIWFLLFSKKEQPENFVEVLSDTCAYVRGEGVDEFLRKYGNLIISMEPGTFPKCTGYYFILHDTKLYSDYSIKRK